MEDKYTQFFFIRNLPKFFHKSFLIFCQNYDKCFRACLITLHSNFEIFLKGHPAIEVMLDRRIFER